MMRPAALLIDLSVSSDLPVATILPPCTAWLSTALVEMLSAELAVGGQMRLLSGEGVAQMRQELALSEEESFASGTLLRMRAHSGVDLVLTGAYLVQGREESARLRVDLRLQEATTGEMVACLKKEWGEFKEPVNL